MSSKLVYSGVSKSGVDQAIVGALIKIGDDIFEARNARVGDVIPEDGRVIAIYQLAPMGISVGNIGGILNDRFAEVGDIFDCLWIEAPVEPARVVGAEAHAGGPHGSGQLADDIAAGVKVAERRMRHLAWPEPKSVVVFRSENDIPRSGALEELGPRGRIPPADRLIKRRHEIVVPGVAVVLSVIPGGWAVVDLEAVGVPLRIGVVAKPDFPPEATGNVVERS
jgi:hypothetical protein